MNEQDTENANKLTKALDNYRKKGEKGQRLWDMVMNSPKRMKQAFDRFVAELAKRKQKGKVAVQQSSNDVSQSR